MVMLVQATFIPTDRQLGGLNPALISSDLQRRANRVVKQAKEYVNAWTDRTGALEASIHSFKVDEEGLEWGVTTNIDYAGYVHYGVNPIAWPGELRPKPFLAKALAAGGGATVIGESSLP
jgi:hypothetical protein